MQPISSLRQFNNIFEIVTRLSSLKLIPPSRMTHLLALLLLPILISCSAPPANAKHDQPPTNSDFHPPPSNDQPPAKVLVYSIGEILK